MNIFDKLEDFLTEGSHDITEIKYQANDKKFRVFFKDDTTETLSYKQLQQKINSGEYKDNKNFLNKARKFSIGKLKEQIKSNNPNKDDEFSNDKIKIKPVALKNNNEYGIMTYDAFIGVSNKFLQLPRDHRNTDDLLNALKREYDKIKNKGISIPKSEKARNKIVNNIHRMIKRLSNHMIMNESTYFISGLMEFITEATSDNKYAFENIEIQYNENNIAYRACYDFNTGHKLKVLYDSTNAEVIETGKAKTNAIMAQKYPDLNKDQIKELHIDELEKIFKNELKKLQKDFKTRGTVDYKGINEVVTHIIDDVNGRHLKSAKVLSPMFVEDLFKKDYKYNNIDASRFNAIPSQYMKFFQNKAQIPDKNGRIYISDIKLGDIDEFGSYKTKKWYSNIYDDKTGDDLSWKSQRVAEFGSKKAKGSDSTNNYVAAAEMDYDPDKRGFRLLGHHYKLNPNKKEALEELKDRKTVYTKALKEASSNEEKEKYKKYLDAVNEDIKKIENGVYERTWMKKYREWDGHKNMSKRNIGRTKAERSKNNNNPKNLKLIENIGKLIANVYKSPSAYISK